MKASYWQRGEALDYKNTTTSAIPANTVIPLVTRIGIAGNDIEPGQTGTIHVTGVFEMQKVDADEISMGTLVYFSEDGITATSDGNVSAGYAAQDSAADAKTILVKLLG